jgi:monofunctional biosynthetic peptidoglycan transglycosylase
MKNFFLTCWKTALRAGVFFVTFSIVLVIVLRWLPVSYTPLMFIRSVQNIGEKSEIEHKWVSSSEISNHLQLAVVCTEDQNFLNHHGFDFASIQKAMDEAEEGGRQRGASTISQQTAKNVFLWPSSSFIRKGFEVWFTVLIELFWNKQRILEVYLNSVEFGDEIYGCEAASEKFFHKHASQLTEVESARLAIVLPNPLKYNAGKLTAYLLRRQTWALSQIHNWGGVLKFGADEEKEVKIRPGKRSLEEDTK